MKPVINEIGVFANIVFGAEEATAGTMAHVDIRCEYLGCQKDSITKTDAKDFDGTIAQYEVCEEHVGQMDCITVVGKILS